MVTEDIAYVSYVEAVLIHIELMRLLNEEHYGVFDRSLIESALARAKQAASYEGADLIRQAASLYYGLIRNPWIGGNKRTATAIVDEFLFRNGLEVTASTPEIIELVLETEADRWKVNEIEAWLRNHVSAIE